MNILLTGAAGFIGSKTAEFLLAAGHRVVGFDSVNDYYDVRLKEYRLAQLLRHEHFNFQRGDVENFSLLSGIFQGGCFDAVVHLAARAGVRASIETPDLYLRTNALGTLNVLQAMVAHGVRKLVMASTSSLYAGQATPFLESSVVTNPLSPYAASKLAGEALCHVWHHLYQIDISILRYFTVFGPAGRPDMAPFRFSECIRRGVPIPLFGDGSQTRDFTFIDDIARGTIAALKNIGFEIVNLGGGNEPLSIIAMISHLEQALDREAVIEYQPGFAADMTDTSADISKAADIFDWEPAVSPVDGLYRCAAWHRENASWLDHVVI
jgi:UDP-glucuronate 4-epimerase